MRALQPRAASWPAGYKLTPALQTARGAAASRLHAHGRALQAARGAAAAGYTLTPAPANRARRRAAAAAGYTLTPGPPKAAAGVVAPRPAGDTATRALQPTRRRGTAGSLPGRSGRRGMADRDRRALPAVLARPRAQLRDRLRPAASRTSGSRSAGV